MAHELFYMNGNTVSFHCQTGVQWVQARQMFYLSAEAPCTWRCVYDACIRFTSYKQHDFIKLSIKLMMYWEAIINDRKFQMCVHTHARIQTHTRIWINILCEGVKTVFWHLSICLVYLCFSVISSPLRGKKKQQLFLIIKLQTPLTGWGETMGCQGLCPAEQTQKW